jgi:Flp pilus assembly protein TadD
LLSYARALQALDEINDAVRAAARATKVAPQDARGHHLLGKLALAAGDRKLALKELKEAKRLDKKDQTIGQDLALAEKKR